MSIVDVSPSLTEAFRGNATPAHEIAISVVSEHPTASNVQISCLPASSAWAMLLFNTKATRKWFCARVKRQTTPCHGDSDVVFFTRMPTEPKAIGESRVASAPHLVAKACQHPTLVVMGLTMSFVIRAVAQRRQMEMQVA